MQPELVLALAYLIGSFSPSYFLGRLRGLDLRQHGTKSLGTSNVFLTLGKKSALLTLLLDVGKGFLAVWFAQNLAEPWVYAAGLATVLGHIYPFYLHFKGGQGAATTAGVLLYLLFNGENLPHRWTAAFVAFLYILLILSYRRSLYERNQRLSHKPR